jgi:hypothetical protein
MPGLRFILCNIYLPPAIAVYSADLSNLIEQLFPPIILLGDFNAKKILRVVALYAEFHLILERRVHTHLCLGSGTLSTLDLTFCSLQLAVHCEWSPLPDLHGSDHYP